MPDKAAERAKVAVFISGTGSAALLYASRVADCPYEIVLVASNDPDAPGLRLAEAEGIATFGLAHKGVSRTEHETALDDAARQVRADYIALAGYMRRRDLRQPCSRISLPHVLGCANTSPARCACSASARMDM